MNSKEVPVWQELRRSIQRSFRKTVREYGLLSEGDRVLIGLSGGKDSLALVEFLGELRRSVRFEALAVHVTMSHAPYSVDIGWLEGYCRSFGIDFVHREVLFVPDENTQRNICFMCSWTRRKVLFETAREFSMSKLALGHNLDDVLETLLMNMTFQGSISAIPPALKMDTFDLTLIRPLCRVEESLLAEYARLRNLVRKQKNCPYEKESHRASVKEVLHQLREMNPRAFQSLWGAMSNVMPEYLPPKPDKTVILPKNPKSSDLPESLPDGH